MGRETMPPKVRGFSLMEFTVAGVLGAAVLAAAGAVYFKVARLNSAAAVRLDGEHQRVLFAEAVRRDFSQAGRFGCADLADGQTQVVGANGAADLLDGGRPQRSGVRQVSAADLHLPDFAAASPVLLSIYGSGVTQPQQIVRAADGKIIRLKLPPSAAFAADEALAVADCRLIVQTGAADSDGLVSADIGDMPDERSVSVMRYVAAAYAVGRKSGEQHNGLYRFERLADGSWDGRRLLDDVEPAAFQAAFAYTDCRGGAARFRFRSRPEAERPPVWLRVSAGGVSAETAVEGGLPCR